MAKNSHAYRNSAFAPKLAFSSYVSVNSFSMQKTITEIRFKRTKILRESRPIRIVSSVQSTLAEIILYENVLSLDRVCDSLNCFRIRRPQLTLKTSSIMIQVQTKPTLSLKSPGENLRVIISVSVTLTNKKIVAILSEIVQMPSRQNIESGSCSFRLCWDFHKNFQQLKHAKKSSPTKARAVK